MSTLAAIGDLHGHAPALHSLLAALERRGGLFAAPGRLLPDAKLVFTGDYIDRGDAGLAVIDRLRELQAANPGQVVTLLGNHELLALESLDEARRLAPRDPPDAFAGYRFSDHGMNGGVAFIAEFGGPGGEGAFARYVARMGRGGDVGDWIRNLVPFHRERVGKRRFLFTHGDVPESLRSVQGLASFGEKVAFRMAASSRELGGTAVKYGDRMFTSDEGSVFWCRDFRELARTSPRAVRHVCKRAGADFIVTGHSMNRGRIVSYGDRIFDIDVGMSPTYGENEPQTLLVTEEGISALTAGGVETSLVAFGR